MVQAQSPTVARTATPAKETAPAEPTGSPRTAPTTTPGPTGADAETFASELSESELACLAGTADIGRLSRIFSGLDEPPPEELTEIMGCLQEETLLRMFLSGVVQDPAPLSMETSACIRTGFEGIDLRSAMLAAMVGNGPNDMMVAGVFVTLACLNDEEWETVATVMGVDLGARANMQCLLEEIGGTEGMTAALEAGAEGNFTAQILTTTGCEPEMERGTEPATTLVITIVPIPADIPEYDRGDWKHWTDADGDCQDARQEVLVKESLNPVTFEKDRKCIVEDDRWQGAFDGHDLGDTNYMDIDHLVPLQNAHLSGAWVWSPEEKQQYANNLGDDDHLIAVAYRANRSKGARGPEEWKPSDETYWCQYATDWTEIKARWDRTMTEPEAEPVVEMLQKCENPPEVDVREALESATGEHKPEPAEELRNPVYGSCEEAEFAGEQRFQGSQGGGLGYPKAMVPSARDGDGDGVVCER